MSPLEPSYTTTAGPEYSNTAEAQENDITTNARKMVEVLTEEMNKSVKEAPEKDK